jgi:hypothetical protein
VTRGDEDVRPGVAQRTLVALIVGAFLLGCVVGAVLTGVFDTDHSATPHAAVATTTTTRAPATTTTTLPVLGAPGPPCTDAAVLTAIQQSGVNAVSVAGVRCGNGWAGASYQTAQISGASLLRAQATHWVVADRVQSCNDATIPPDVHFYCTVS